MAPQTLKLPDWFKQAHGSPCPTGGRAKAMGFLDRNLSAIASFMRRLMDSEEHANLPGVLQLIDPRARIAGVLVLITASAVASSSFMVASLAFTVLGFALASEIGLKALLKRVFPSFIFTLVIIAPMLFSFMSPGRDILRLTENVSVTMEGVRYASFFVARVTTMMSMAALLLLTTRQTDFFRGLRDLPVPSLFVTALFMTFRYIFILIKIAEDAVLAMKSRTIKGTGLRQSQRWVASRLALILRKSLNTADEVNMAMASRGFQGRVKTFDNHRMRGGDYLWLGFSFFMLFISFGF